MRIVYANQDDTGVVSLVDDDAIVELWNWNLSGIVVDVEMVLSRDSTDIFQLNDAPCSRVHVQIDVTVSREDSGENGIMKNDELFADQIEFGAHLVPSSTAAQFRALNFCH